MARTPTDKQQKADEDKRKYTQSGDAESGKLVDATVDPGQEGVNKAGTAINLDREAEAEDDKPVDNADEAQRDKVREEADAFGNQLVHDSDRARFDEAAANLRASLAADVRHIRGEEERQFAAAYDQVHRQ